MSPRRRFALARLLLPLALGLPGPLLAQSSTPAPAWPSRPVRLVAPYAPGGLTDVLARLVAQKAAGSLGQPIVVESRRSPTRPCRRRRYRSSSPTRGPTPTG